ncbi:MAG: outer membrane protein assembly factor BamE [Rhodospirillaceae bacterium]|jgi:outer membrane protein assembly factor BamE (lipoprotein component of BamABCDE complex)|nr:outer membrane protein assembly factor BamE [Rhodospirillaceae bacterium]
MSARDTTPNPLRPRALFLALPLVGLLVACDPRVGLHGHRVDVDALAEVVPGRTDRTQVELLLGSPSSKGGFGSESWYYVSSRVEHKAFLKPNLVERKVVFVSFDDRGLVTAIGSLDKADGKHITYVDRETPTAGQRITLLQQLIGNVGRFNKPAE